MRDMWKAFKQGYQSIGAPHPVNVAAKMVLAGLRWPVITAVVVLTARALGVAV